MAANDGADLRPSVQWNPEMQDLKFTIDDATAIPSSMTKPGLTAKREMDITKLLRNGGLIVMPSTASKTYYPDGVPHPLPKGTFLNLMPPTSALGAKIIEALDHDPTLPFSDWNAPAAAARVYNLLKGSLYNDAGAMKKQMANAGITDVLMLASPGPFCDVNPVGALTRDWEKMTANGHGDMRPKDASKADHRVLFKLPGSEEPLPAAFKTMLDIPSTVDAKTASTAHTHFRALCILNVTVAASQLACMQPSTLLTDASESGDMAELASFFKSFLLANWTSFMTSFKDPVSGLKNPKQGISELPVHVAAKYACFDARDKKPPPPLPQGVNFPPPVCQLHALLTQGGMRLKPLSVTVLQTKKRPGGKKTKIIPVKMNNATLRLPQTTADGNPSLVLASLRLGSYATPIGTGFTATLTGLVTDAPVAGPGEAVVEINPDSAGAKLAKMLANEDDDSSDDDAGDDGHSVSSGRKRSADDADLAPPGSPELYGGEI